METSAPDPSRTDLAEGFLREAVMRSRSRQATEHALASADPKAADCGLGHSAAFESELSERGLELYRALFPAQLSEPKQRALLGLMSEWVRRQDAFDRERNHFLKDFRHRHGFDRRAYSPELERAFEAGLDEINGKANAALRSAAERLLTL